MTPELRRRATLAVIDGKVRDELSVLAFAAWERRWRRVPVGFGRRLDHLLRAAVTMDPTVLRGPEADIDRSRVEAVPPERWPVGAASMPLGAMRAIVSDRGRYWEPVPDGERAGQWLAALPIYEAREGRTVTAGQYILWTFGGGHRDQKTGKTHQPSPDLIWAYYIDEEIRLGAYDDDAPPDALADIKRTIMEWAAEATVAMSPRYLAAHEIVAFDPREPSRWWLRTGAVDALGKEQAELDLAAGKPVRVYATPAVWNRAGAGGAPGCCVLDWKSSWARHLLIEAHGLIGDSIEHGEELKKRTIRTLPTVAVATRRKAA